MTISYAKERKNFAATIVLLIFIGLQTPGSKAEGAGEKAFNESCGICHTLGGGRLVGPDLADVQQRRSQEWLLRFIKSSQSMIKAEDAQAVAVFEAFNKMPMPDSLLSEEQIMAVLDYIETGSSPQEVKPVKSPLPNPAPQEASAEDIELGQNLFQGTIRFEKGGPTCNACHEVNNDAVIGGGILAAELTRVFSRMGGTGVRAILGSPPFPVMQAAYKDKSLTDKENSALVAFLQHADKEHPMQQPRDYGTGLFISGLAGTTILFGLCSLIWRGRKKESVNQQIFDRQIKSVSDPD